MEGGTVYETNDIRLRPDWRWTPLTVLVLVGLLVGIVTLPWYFTAGDLIAIPLGLVVGYWIVGGCARRGEPLAQWLMRHVPMRHLP